MWVPSNGGFFHALGQSQGSPMYEEVPAQWYPWLRDAKPELCWW